MHTSNACTATQFYISSNVTSKHLSFSTDTKYAVKDVFEGAAYEFRVSAINLSGAGDPSIPCDTVIARDPMSKPEH